MLEEATDLTLFSAKQHGVAIDLRVPAESPPVLVDKVQIQQVMVNLLRNAIEAMEASPRREIGIEVLPPKDGLVTVAVTDTGPGIDDHVAERLFQPFTTTKTQGMGVGLALCRSIIEGHGGRLWAEPVPDGGTAFRFSLPMVPVAAAVV